MRGGCPGKTKMPTTSHAPQGGVGLQRSDMEARRWEDCALDVVRLCIMLPLRPLSTWLPQPTLSSGVLPSTDRWRACTALHCSSVVSLSRRWGRISSHMCQLSCEQVQPEEPAQQKRAQFVTFNLAIRATGDTSRERFEGRLGRHRYEEYRDALIRARLALKKTWRASPRTQPRRIHHQNPCNPGSRALLSGRSPASRARRPSHSSCSRRHQSRPPA